MSREHCLLRRWFSVRDSMEIKCILPRLASCPIKLNEAECKEIQQLVNRHTTPQQIALRAQIILQAIERKAPDLPLRPGKVQRREFEYVRHGTQTLIANFDVVTGQGVTPTCGDSRTEADFVAHIQQTVESDLGVKLGFVRPGAR